MCLSITPWVAFIFEGVRLKEDERSESTFSRILLLYGTEKPSVTFCPPLSLGNCPGDWNGHQPRAGSGHKFYILWKTWMKGKEARAAPFPPFLGKLQNVYQCIERVSVRPLHEEGGNRDLCKCCKQHFMIFSQSPGLILYLGSHCLPSFGKTSIGTFF